MVVYFITYYCGRFIFAATLDGDGGALRPLERGNGGVAT